MDVTSTGGLELLDPTAERESGDRPLAAPIDGATGLRIALLDIRKPRGDVFLDQLERLLSDRGFLIERTAKPTFTRPAPADLRREIAERCDALVEALAD
jgi:hypothetical protein